MGLSNNIHDMYDNLKSFYLAAAHSAIIAGYSIIRPIKSSIFLSFVGVEYQPSAKLASFLIAPLLVFLYSKLVSSAQRHQVATLCLGIYAGVIGVFGLILLHPTIGIANQALSVDRWAGWGIYMFLDFFAVFILGTFWGFSNSISSPTFASNHYGKISAAARIAGIASPLLSLLVMQYLAPIASIPILCATTSVLLFGALYCIQRIHLSVPKEYLAGYSKDPEAAEPHPTNKRGWLDGLKVLISEPYVFGIFVLVYSFNFVSTFADFKMQLLMSQAYNHETGAIAQFMLIYTALFQAVGFIFAYVGTKTMLKRFGVPLCLLVSPIITAGLLMILINYKTLAIATAVMVIFRALNYGFNQPIREMLFIPTTETVQFKSKAWIESFGQTLSESLSSVFNRISVSATSQTSANIFVRFMSTNSHLASLLITGTWIFSAILLGKKYHETITHGKVIGRRQHQ